MKKKRKITKKELLRLKELEKKARDTFLEYSDYNIEDWLDTKKEKTEFKLLFNKFLRSL